jgi:carboxypeptidase Taq
MNNKPEALQELKTRMQEISDLYSVISILHWDQSTYMPDGGAMARGRTTATIARIAQEKMTNPEIGRLLDALELYGADLPYDDDDASLIRITRRDFERAIKVPPAFTAEFFNHRAVSFSTWAKARPENDFKAVEPLLEKTLDLSHRYADFFPGYDHPADPHIDRSDYGMKAAAIREVFADLREQLVPLVESISDQALADDSCLTQYFPKDAQLKFGEWVVRQFGYDFTRGRQDLTHHPFMTGFSIDDVRITTRVNDHFLSEALFGTMHEAGHAMYGQGVDIKYEATPLAPGTSSGVHESQSRLWENLVGRSLPFWRRFYPQLQATFPEQLGQISLDTFYRAINKVERSLIRVEADEVTYNLHVMIRFDLELALLEGDLTIKDLPDAWHARYESDLGLRAPDNRDGVMQDVHWYGGMIGGAFQGYTLGNIMSSLFFEAAQKAHPGLIGEIEVGEFGNLLGWLTENIYQHGRKYTADDLVQRITDRPLTIEPYIHYLKTKFGELYGI